MSFSIIGQREGYLPKEQRKKILLLCDDLRMHSGIATMAREFVMGTAHKYNWAQIAGAVQHPEKGRVMNLNDATKVETGIVDPYVQLYPVDGYGSPEILNEVMGLEKPDAILHFTDPRFWIWLYGIEREVRQKVPIGFYSIWDDLPYPMYNRPFYQSCDWIGCISKQTENIVKSILGTTYNKPTTVTYVPHGINPDVFRPLTSEADLAKVAAMKKSLFKKDYKYVVLYNSRNIRRKQTSSIMLAYRAFCDNLPKEEAAKCVFLLHTNPVEDAGTDLIACKEALCPNYDVLFSNGKYGPAEMNILYNLADVTINLSDNEGFGLGTAESLMAGTPIIVTVTGGLQDQCGFQDESGKLVEFDTTWGSNHDGRYQKHGKWVTPIYPGARLLQGSIPTPYILADYARWEDAAEALMYWYSVGHEKRTEYGALGREYANGIGGLNSGNMCNKMIEGLDSMMVNWKGREKFNLHRHDEYVGHQMPDNNLGFIIPPIDKDKVLSKFNK
jgi:glycosyltransferase involved in cell wall biosynthesis